MEYYKYRKEAKEEKMTSPKVFISFDFDNDSDLRDFLVGQSKNPDSPFEIQDYSLKEPLSGDWKEKIKTRIRRCEQVIVLCGHKTDTATGVDIELRITQEERKSYFLLAGRKEGENKSPKSLLSTDKMYKWTWENLKLLIQGQR